MKSSPYPDPADGQFTLAPGGGTASRSGTDGSHGCDRRRSTDPKHPRNNGIYTVKVGDTLRHIAATRAGLTPADLSWLNDLRGDRIVVGQQLRVPHQALLEEGKRAFETVVALQRYMDRHGGQLPPEIAHPPTLFEQHSGPDSRAQRTKRLCLRP